VNAPLIPPLDAPLDARLDASLNRPPYAPLTASANAPGRAYDGVPGHRRTAGEPTGGEG
jgi:hypothetical protein